MRRGAVTHVVILDGTLSSLSEGRETNAGLTYRLLSEAAQTHDLWVHYEAGIQWTRWRDTRDVLEGRGINRQIRRCYGALASHYHEGDKVFLFGYSRGAYAVRSLAGLIGHVGLLKAPHATERNVQLAYRHYQVGASVEAREEFARLHCHDNVDIEMIGVWDTVKALGIRLPFLWKYSQEMHDFHDTHLAPHVKRGYHALAYHETREAYAPVLWTTDPAWSGLTLQQMWFRGSHGDVGGQLGGRNPERRLSNATLLWMLDKAETAGLPLPGGWRSRYLADPNGTMIGTNKSWGKFFLARKKRVVGADPSEVLHPSVRSR